MASINLLLPKDGDSKDKIDAICAKPISTLHILPYILQPNVQPMALILISVIKNQMVHEVLHHSDVPGLKFFSITSLYTTSEGRVETQEPADRSLNDADDKAYHAHYLRFHRND